MQKIKKEERVQKNHGIVILNLLVFYSFSGYISQYILTGTKHSSWTGTPSDYTIRNWSMYENSRYNASNARVLTKTDLDNWYNKYMGVTNANTYTVSKFQRIYSSPYLSYQNLIDNHTDYWLGSARDETSTSTLSTLYCVGPNGRYLISAISQDYGVRVLVSIPLTSIIQEKPVARRTVTLDTMTYNGGTYGSESVQEYNVWELE